MEPKVAAVADFVAGSTNGTGVIGAPDQIAAILAGTSGTRIVRSHTDSASEDSALIAVNGTLMRGLKLNPNLLRVGGAFVREASTKPTYRIWSVNDEHPAMIRVNDDSGASVALEVWAVPLAGIADLLRSEPPGLTIGKVELSDGGEVLGVLAESALVEGQREITEYGGWRAYVETQGVSS